MSLPRLDKEQYTDTMSTSTTVVSEDLERPPRESKKARSLKVITALSTLTVLTLTILLVVSTFYFATPSAFYQQTRGKGLTTVPLASMHPQAAEPTSQNLTPSSTQADMPHHSEWLKYCGNDTLGAAHARSLGCKFDVMSFSWLPPACFDEELTASFRNYTPSGISQSDAPDMHWKWWSDPDGIHEVSLDRVMRGEFEELYVDFEYHLVHCTYMWRKMHRALLRASESEGLSETSSVALESYLLNMKHTAHCEKMLLASTGRAASGGLKPIDGGKVGTVIKRKFPECVRVSHTHG